MAQKRFWNFKDDDLTISINQWLIGLIDSGRYRGYDGTLDNTMVLKLHHNTTGAILVNKTGNWSDKYGIVRTKQGTIIQEYDPIQLAVDTTEDKFHRRDLIVLNHEYIETVGGQTAYYSIIKGREVPINALAVTPLLPDEEKQVIIGELYLPSNTDQLNNVNVTYTPAKQPRFGNHVEFIEKSDGFFITDLDARSNRIINLENPTEEQDAATKFYVDQAILNNVVWASEIKRGIAKLATSADIIAGTDHSKILTTLKFLEAYLLKRATQSEANNDTQDLKFITPKTLANRTSTETRKGVAKVATIAEAKAGENDATIITPFKLRKALPLYPVTVELGSWGISGVAPYTHLVNHGLGGLWDKVVSASLIMIEDDNSSRYLSTIEDIEIGPTQAEIILSKIKSGADFNATGFNRGFISFWIKEDLPTITDILIVNAGQDIESTFISTDTKFAFVSGFAEAIGSPITSLAWTCTSKPTGAVVSFEDIDQVETRISLDIYGDYTFVLTATNGNGDTQSDSVVVKILEQTNTAPVINDILNQGTASIDATHEGVPVPIDGWKKISVAIDATDVDGDTLTYTIQEVDSYDFVSGTYGNPVVGSSIEVEQGTLPNAFTIRGLRLDGMQTPLADGGGFYYFTATANDGNGGTHTKGFRAEIFPEEVIFTPVFFMSNSPNNSNTDYAYSGSLILNPVSQVTRLTAVISGINNNGSNQFDRFGVLLEIGTTGSLFTTGTYDVPNSVLASSIPLRFTLTEGATQDNSQGFLSATVTFRAYNGNGDLIGTHTIGITKGQID